MKIHPKPIHSGDTVAIVSTSSPVPPADIRRLVDYFERRGHAVRVMPHAAAATGYLAGDAESRAADLMAAFEDPKVRMIIPASGGKGAAHLLSLINYETIAKNPKIIVGLSDPSILLNAITAKTGLVTLHGPTGYDFSRPQVDVYTESNFWRIVSGSIDDIEIIGTDWRVLRGSGRKISGRIIGGHLGTIRALVGTDLLPEVTGAILFLEEVFVPWAQIDAALTHMRLAGVFDRIAALVIGTPVECQQADSPDASWEEMILRCVGGSCPIVTNAEFGHTPRKFSLPIGAKIELELATQPPFIRYMEDFVE